jgi:hypothetical protein
MLWTFSLSRSNLMRGRRHKMDDEDDEDERHEDTQKEHDHTMTSK